MDKPELLPCPNCPCAYVCKLDNECAEKAIADCAAIQGKEIDATGVSEVSEDARDAVIEECARLCETEYARNDGISCAEGIRSMLERKANAD